MSSLPTNMLHIFVFCPRCLLFPSFIDKSKYFPGQHVTVMIWTAAVSASAS